MRQIFVSILCLIIVISTSLISVQHASAHIGDGTAHVLAHQIVDDHASGHDHHVPVNTGGVSENAGFDIPSDHGAELHAFAIETKFDLQQSVALKAVLQATRLPVLLPPPLLISDPDPDRT